MIVRNANFCLHLLKTNKPKNNHAYINISTPNYGSFFVNQGIGQLTLKERPHLLDALASLFFVFLVFLNVLVLDDIMSLLWSLVFMWQMGITWWPSLCGARLCVLSCFWVSSLYLWKTGAWCHQMIFVLLSVSWGKWGDGICACVGTSSPL